MTEVTEIQPIKAFISYSWSSPEHEQWVIDLAEQLCNDGVDIQLDKWGLKEGHDKFSFMEKDDHRSRNKESNYCK
jgi:hypothetical protein